MNCNMMCKKNLFCFCFLVIIGLGQVLSAGVFVSAEVTGGDILIIYSDRADESTMEKVDNLVEILTYQSFQVSYAPVSESMSSMDDFSYILCYDLKNYPKAFLNRLKLYEDMVTGQKGKKTGHILFAGNDCVKDYYDYTGRSGDYELVNSSLGKMDYSFDGLVNMDGLVKEDYFVFLKNVPGYQNGIISVNSTKGYVSRKDGVITHIPVTDIQDNLIRAAFIKEVARWKWPYDGSPAIYAQYILINQVYPYQDPAKLFDIVKLLAEEKTSFVISVMPIYVNGNYPAMDYFCEILRYAQANGGAVVLHAPINQMSTFDKKTMMDYLAQALKIYINQGVYPLALQVPRNWMFCEDTIEIMSHFKTIFTSEEKDPNIVQSDMQTNKIYKDGHQWVGTAVALDDLGTSYLSTYSAAVSISMEADITDIKKVIAACQTSPIPLKSLWDMEHSFWTDKELMTYRNQNLFLNYEKIDLSFVPGTYTEDYDYRRNILKRFSKDLSSQNRKLIILVFLTSFLFLFFIIIARYRNRRNYFFRDGKNNLKR